MIHNESVATLAEAIRLGERTSLVTTEHYLQRARASELNAFTLLDEQGARQAAHAVDTAVRSGEELGPLAGVPLAVKDIFDQAGLPNTAGSAFYRNVPARSATVVERLQRAGAVIIGRTGLHEFAFGFTSENQWFGPVRNPWDPRTSPGGSSGGSAVATAAGLSAASLGTDTGGSVRGPAALCGVVGLKPTHGRVPNTGVFPLAPSLDTVGPLTRSVADAALIYSVIAGFDEADPWSVRGVVEVPTEPADPAGLRVGIPGNWLRDGPVQRLVVDAFSRATGALERLGAFVEEFEAPYLEPGPELGWSVGAEVASVHREFRQDPENTYGSVVESRMEIAETVSVGQYVRAMEWRARLRQAFGGAFESYDLLITPTVGSLRKVIGVDDIDIEGEPVHHRPVLSWFTAPVNHAGLPALVLPLRPSQTEPPVSLQLIASWWQEQALLAMGWTLESEGVAGFVPPPGF